MRIGSVNYRESDSVQQHSEAVLAGRVSGIRKSNWLSLNTLVKYAYDLKKKKGEICDSYRRFRQARSGTSRSFMRV